MEAINKLWNDKTGVAVNKFLRKLANILLIVSMMSCAIGVIGFAYWAFEGFYVADITVFLGSIVLALGCFFGSVNLLWFATLGENVIKMTKQQGGNNTDYSALPKL